MKQLLKTTVTVLLLITCRAQLFEVLNKQNNEVPETSERPIFFLEKRDVHSVEKKMEVLDRVSLEIEEAAKKKELIERKKSDLSGQIKEYVEKKNITVAEPNGKKGKFEKLQEDVHSEANKMKQLINKIQIKVKEIEDLITEKTSKVTSMNLTFKEMKTVDVKTKLEVGGLGEFKKINTDQLILPSVKIEDSRITFLNDNLRIVSGNNTTTVKDLFRGIRLLNGLSDKCGADLTKCKTNFGDSLKMRIELEVII